MNTSNPNWEQLKMLFTASLQAQMDADIYRRQFVSVPAYHRVVQIEQVFREGEPHLALWVCKALFIEERKLFLEEFVNRAGFPDKFVPLAHELILSLPRDYTVANIEKYVEPFLHVGGKGKDYPTGTSIEWAMFLTLYQKLDVGLTRRLAERAIQHSDPYIQEEGKHFLANINSTT